MKILEYNSTYAAILACLFHDSVHAISLEVYSQEQVNAWAPTPPDLDFWEKRFQRTQPFIGLINQSAAGFIELTGNGYIDCLYVHPDFQRRGVATALHAHIEEKARVAGVSSLTVDASKVAKIFFLNRDFQQKRMNTVHRNGVTLVNFHMVKILQ